MGQVLYPSSNRLGIPDLLPQDAGGIPVPVRGWGTVGRTTPNSGTWHFYVDDWRFAVALRDPERVLLTGCAAVVEPNVSTYDDTPAICALETIYRKRLFARHLQSCGLRVFVDLNLPERVLDLPEWRYGIPAGWSAFATRGYDRRLEHLDYELAVACRFHPAPTLLVVGGGRATAEWCVAAGAYHAGYRGARNVHSEEAVHVQG